MMVTRRACACVRAERPTTRPAPGTKEQDVQRIAPPGTGSACTMRGSAPASTAGCGLKHAAPPPAHRVRAATRVSACAYTGPARTGTGARSAEPPAVRWPSATNKEEMPTASANLQEDFLIVKRDGAGDKLWIVRGFAGTDPTAWREQATREYSARPVHQIPC